VGCLAPWEERAGVWWENWWKNHFRDPTTGTVMIMELKVVNFATSKDLVVEVRCSLIVTKYMLLSHHQNARQNHDIKIANRCFKNVTWFRYLVTTVTNQNLIQEEIKRRLNLGNACYHSVQKLLSSCLLSHSSLHFCDI
jgi:hypothetical protein